MKLNRMLGVSTILLLLCVGYGLANAQNVNADILGDWRISSDLTPEGAITSKSQVQVHTAMGKILRIRPSNFAFDGNHCSNPTYQRSTDDTQEYFRREWRIDAATLPLSRKLTIVDVGCAFYLIYPIDQRRLMIADDGVFLEAVRVEKPVPSLSRCLADCVPSYRVVGRAPVRKRVG